MAAAFDLDSELYRESRDWIERECIAEPDLHSAVGVDRSELEALRAAAVLPCPTYQLFETGIASPIASIGAPGRTIGTYFGTAVIGWLRRASVFYRSFGVERLGLILKEWLDADFRGALMAQSEAAAEFGWAHLFDRRILSPAAFEIASAELWTSWLKGGWAVCLNHFSGYDVVTKDIELERIPRLVAERDNLASLDPCLIDAMLRFDAVVRPFAPFERPISSRRRVIDSVALGCGVPWPVTDDYKHLQATGRGA